MVQSQWVSLNFNVAFLSQVFLHFEIFLVQIREIEAGQVKNIKTFNIAHNMQGEKPKGN